MLNKKRNRRSTISELTEMLSRIPERLGELFQDILAQDDNDEGSTHLCLRWLLFSTRPLKREELYFAIRSARDQDVSVF